MALAPFDLFAGIVAALSGLVRCFDRLAVDDGCAGGDASAFAVTQPVAHRVVDESPSPVLVPLAEVAIDRLPGAKVLGQVTPGAAGAVHVKNGIEQCAAVQFERTSALGLAGFRGWHQSLDLVPFFISEITRILYRMHLHPIHL